MNMQNPSSAHVDQVLHAVTSPDRIPAKRYYDPAFYALENERLWPRVWQMACRLEEIPARGDYVVYRNLDQSVIVIRTGDNEVKAFQNHCRHRGVELVQSKGRTAGGFVCPFHGWRWNVDGESTFVYAAEAFAAENLAKSDLDLVPVRLETWGGCAFINFDDDALPLRASLGAFADKMDQWRVENLRVEWWKAARIPCNWKLAMEAFLEGYHVATTHPQLLPPGSSSRPGECNYFKLPEECVDMSFWVTTPALDKMPAEIEPRVFIETYIDYMKRLSAGMAGMTHAQEIAVAETLLDMDLPRDPMQAQKAFRRALNSAVEKHYADMGTPAGDLNAIDAQQLGVAVNYCFPNYFILPTYGSASAYRIRPLGPEECLFELWSLTRYPKGQEPEPPKPPQAMPHDDPSWPAIPKQDYSNLPRQQLGLHGRGFEFMRLSKDMEGLISNYQRLIDGYLGGVAAELLVDAVSKASGPIDVPVADLGF